MQLQLNEIYHIYNRGNNKSLIFYKQENYSYFLQKIQKYISPVCEILCYCLMPNHFHLLIYTTDTTLAASNDKTGVSMNNFAYGLKLLLSSYAKAINKQENRQGSLFTQNTNGVQVSNDSIWDDYAIWCFYYIHQNPVRAGLVNGMIEWEFSSFRELKENRKTSICNKELATRLLYLQENTWLFEENYAIPERIEKRININQ